MESGTFPQTLCFARFLACSSDFTLSSYRKKPPLSSAFNPHEHELLEMTPPGERPAAAGGSRPARQNQTTRSRCRGEGKPMEHRTRSPKGAATAALDDLVSMVFGAVPAGEDSLPRQGEPSRSGRNQTARPRGRREKTDGTPNQKPKRGCDCCLGRSCQHGFWRGPSRGNGLPRQGGAVRPGKNQTTRPQGRRERKPMKHNTKNRKGAAA